MVHPEQKLGYDLSSNGEHGDQLGFLLAERFRIYREQFVALVEFFRTLKIRNYRRPNPPIHHQSLL